jgi:hypothetical protein
MTCSCLFTFHVAEHGRSQPCLYKAHAVARMQSKPHVVMAVSCQPMACVVWLRSGAASAGFVVFLLQAQHEGSDDQRDAASEHAAGNAPLHQQSLSRHTAA